MMTGCGRLNEDEASWLASAMDAVDWPLILIFSSAESGDVEWSITGRLDRTIRLETPPQ